MPLRNGGATVEVTAEMEDERKRLIDWARSAPLDHVAQMLAYIGELDSADAVSSPDQPVEPAVM